MNVLNVEDIERELWRVASYAVHPAARQWVLSVPRNYLLGKIDSKDLSENFRVYDPKHLEPDMPSKLPDWAHLALVQGETLHWFDPVQVRRRPFWKALEYIVNWFNSWPSTDTRLRRLTRINFHTATAAAGVWMGKIANNLWDFVKDRPPVIREYEEGYRWVRLITNLHFERESHLCGHCIGNGAYYSMHKRGDAEYYSLRDKNNTPHCSVEVLVTVDQCQQRKVSQCKGKCNRKPVAQYQRFIRRFFNDMGWEIVGDLSNID